MIRPYKHINSNFHTVQSFVNHLFLDVIFRAPYIAQAVFDTSLVLPKYKPLIDEVNDEYLLNPITECFTICKTLSKKHLKVLKRGVHQNNKIRLLCNGDLIPLEYSDIDLISEDLSQQIKIFFDKLYDKAVNKAVFYHRYGKIEDYYKNLVGKSRTCRCCGINKVLIKYHSKRSALDHYLPRNHFPFTSINTNNLLPICNTCNSTYKLAENTIFEIIKRNNRIVSKIRKQAFFPFSRINPYPRIDVEITLNKAFSEDIEPNDMNVNLVSAGYEEHVETWNRLFGIKENYLAECCSEEMQVYYEEQYMADMNFGKTHDQYVATLEANRLYDMNFLRIAYLNGINNYA
ncbi:hypothetical protein [Flavobacterium lindanitolerans]|uniref:hypothetical protein n=1 Tax=Flavobacterium lindanitolerans TaxID=428988 RepID=UPI0027B8C754|nr:hypothetical protein [Flavobacterium lindanitolerans]